MVRRALQSDPLHLILGKPLLGPIIELGRARAFMSRHLLRVFQSAAVGQIRRDSRRPERMIADRRENANRHRPFADHPPRVRLPHRLQCQLDATMPLRGAEQEPLLVLGDAGGIDVGPQCLGEGMVAGHDMVLAAFLVQPQFPAGALRPQILDFHFQRRADPGEGVGKGGDQRPVPEIAHGLGRDRVEQLAPLLAIEHRRLAGFHHMLRPAHGGGRIVGHDLAGDQPVEQHPDGGELLLHVRRGMGLLSRLYI